MAKASNPLLGSPWQNFRNALDNLLGSLEALNGGVQLVTVLEGLPGRASSVIDYAEQVDEADREKVAPIAAMCRLTLHCVEGFGSLSGKMGEGELNPIAAEWRKCGAHVQEAAVRFGFSRPK